jgi:plasmid stabilization system protein ParE
VTYSVVVRPAAGRDVQRAQDWYSLEAPEQVERFASELEATIDRVRAHPLRFARVWGDARRAYLRVFPYQLWYRVHEELQVVEVLALVHGRQDPSRLRERLT